MIASIVFGSFGLVGALVGMQCSKIGGKNYVLKGRIAAIGGVFFILQGKILQHKNHLKKSLCVGVFIVFFWWSKNNKSV